MPGGARGPRRFGAEGVVFRPLSAPLLIQAGDDLRIGPLLGLPREETGAAGPRASAGRLSGLAAHQLPLRPRRALQPSSSGLWKQRPGSGLLGRGCLPPPGGGRPAASGGCGATARARGGGGGGGGSGEHAQFSRRRQPEQEQSRAAGMEPPPPPGAAAPAEQAQPEEEESAAQPAKAPPGPGAAPRGKARGAGGRRGGAKAQPRLRRPVTVDSSKARTSLDALKISLRQLRWREVRFAAGQGRGRQAQRAGPLRLRGIDPAWPRLSLEGLSRALPSVTGDPRD